MLLKNFMRNLPDITPQMVLDNLRESSNYVSVEPEFEDDDKLLHTGSWIMLFKNGMKIGYVGTFYKKRKVFAEILACSQEEYNETAFGFGEGTLLRKYLSESKRKVKINLSDAVYIQHANLMLTQIKKVTESVKHKD